jgi:hypothetical protein
MPLIIYYIFQLIFLKIKEKDTLFEYFRIATVQSVKI